MNMNKLFVVAVFLFSAQANSSVVVSEWNLLMSARTTVADAVNDQNNTVALPFSEIRTIISSGGTSATVDYDLSVDDNFAVFDFSINLHREGSSGDSQSQVAGDIFFQVSEISNYNFSGFFDLIGDKRITMGLDLRDLTVSGGLSGYVYQSLQRSLTTQNESFIINDLGGDGSNALIGDMTGLLLPGHEYVLGYNFDIITSGGSTDDGADALGGFDFSISAGEGFQDLPIPGMIWLLLSVLIGLPGMLKENPKGSASLEI